MLKKREERIKVLTRARMRSGASWSDVCIVNLSSRGVGLQCAQPPPRGTYVELRRGAHVEIIGCVMWSSGHRFGVRSQDMIWIDGVLNDDAAERPATPEWRERRSKERAPDRAEASAIAGRRLQFGFLVAGAAGAMFVVAGMVQSALAEPMAVLSTALG